MSRYIIAKDGESPFHIAVHQYSDEAVRHAAAELQKYILKSTGAVIPYFSDCCKKRGPEIMLGANVRGETRVESELGDEGFFIRAAGENITIKGESTECLLEHVRKREKNQRRTAVGLYSYGEGGREDHQTRQNGDSRIQQGNLCSRLQQIGVSLEI